MVRFFTHSLGCTALLCLVACSAGRVDLGKAPDTSDPQVDSDDTGSNFVVDEDQDGFAAEDDCDDNDYLAYPDAPEQCDGVDNDCDGEVDEDFDADTDGFPVGEDCEVETDCDDEDATIHPGATDEPYDGIDQDCDGSDLDDVDGDGFASTEVGGNDCDDDDPSTNPAAEETWYDGLDTDCDGQDDYDADGDGQPPEDQGGEDCDDGDASVYTAEQESALDGVDDDCDGLIDEDFVDEGDLLITEIFPEPKSVDAQNGEWFELYNASAEDVELVGWKLEDDDGDGFVILESLVIGSGDYAVLGVSGDESSNGGVTVDYVYDRTDFVLSDSKDSLAVRAGSSVLVEVAYTGSWDLVAGSSISLDSESLDLSAMDDAEQWCAGVSEFGDGDRGTPGEENDNCDGVDHDGDID